MAHFLLLFVVIVATSHTMAIPQQVKRFPRDSWDTVIFTHPPIPQGMLDAKATWAACQASKHWQSAFDDETNNTPVDEVDFALAVFDVAYHLYVASPPHAHILFLSLSLKPTHAHILPARITCLASPCRPTAASQTPTTGVSSRIISLPARTASPAPPSPHDSHNSPYPR